MDGKVWRREGGRRRRKLTLSSMDTSPEIGAGSAEPRRDDANPLAVSLWNEVDGGLLGKLEENPGVFVPGANWVPKQRTFVAISLMLVEVIDDPPWRAPKTVPNLRIPQLVLTNPNYSYRNQTTENINNLSSS